MPIQGVELKSDGSLGDIGNSTLWSGFASDMTNAMDTLLRGGRRNVRSEYVMGKLGVPVMHIWNQTVPFWDFHRLISAPSPLPPFPPVPDLPPPHTYFRCHYRHCQA